MGSLTGAVASLSIASAQALNWNAQLPPHFKRAAFDIFQKIRAHGTFTVRDWFSASFAGSRTSDQWRDLWTLATQVDFKILSASRLSESEVIRVLHTDDSVEIALRRLSDYIFESRTGGSTGAKGIVAPGPLTDIAPTWLITEATAYSTMEAKRADRVSPSRRRQEDSTSNDKGGGKGGGKAKPPWGGRK